MKSSKRPLAILNMAIIRAIGNFIIKAQAIVTNMTNNAVIFVAPVPALPLVTTDINNLETAQGEAETRVAGAAAERNLKYDIVLDDLRGLQRYVQTLADAAPNEAAAIAIINSSGFDLKVQGVRVKPMLVARNGQGAGIIKLVAKAFTSTPRQRASYEWQMSTDGINWTNLPGTLQAKTTVSGLTAGSRYYFRFRYLLKTGVQDWSTIVSVVVSD
jgi:hypothetical protein